MMGTDKRPIYLALTQFHFPAAAIASITHRITGIVLFGGFAFMLYALDMALESERGFSHARALLSSPLGKLVAWLLLAALSYHFIAGLKHMILEIGYGETLVGGQRAAWLTFAVSSIFIVLAGIWIW